MKNITTVITKTVDLDAPDMHQQYLARPLVRGNHQAHEFRLVCTRKGVKVDLTGARVWGYVRRQDGVTIPMEGTVDGHIASVVLSSACYVIPGTVMISIDIEQNNVRSTHALWRATVLHTQSDLISGDAVLSISESLALVEDAALRAESAAERAAATDAGVLAAQVGQLSTQADELKKNMAHKAQRIVYQPNATLTDKYESDISSFYLGAVLDLEMYGANPDKKYSFGTFVRKESYIYITIWDESFTVVCDYNVEETGATGRQLIPFVEKNHSGVTAKALIDFNIFAEGTSYDSLIYQYCGIDSHCYVKTLREKDVENTLSTLKRYEKRHGVFTESATLMSASGEDISEFLCGAIRDICIEGANPDETYAIGQISWNESNVVDIFIWDSAHQVVLVLYVENATGYTGTKTLNLTEFNDSGLTGTITVDFDVLTAGIIHRGMGLESTPIDSDYIFGSLREQKMAQATANLQNEIRHCKKQKGIFKESATLVSASGEDISAFLCGAIRDIYVHGATQGETYAVAQLRWDATNEVMINIWDSDYKYVLAAYIKDASSYTGIRTLDLSELSDSGMFGKITVDFDVFTAGSDYSAMPLESTPIDDAYLFGSLREQNLETNWMSRRWEGKKWYALGDSFTEQNIYPHYLNEYCKFASYHNAGWSGRNMKDMLTKLSEQSTSGFDIVTVLCGTNDYGVGTALGTASDSANADTFYGHTKKVIETILGQNPTARLCFFTPMIRGTFENQPVYPALNNAGVSLEAYVDAIRDVCAAYAIPCCDTFRTSQFNALTLSTLTQDNLHPNDVGGKLLARQMQGFIESL